VPLESPGLWVDIREPGRAWGTPALFVDRDGTLMADHGYLADPGRVNLIDEILPALRQANGAGVPVVVVTNQSGVARGMFGWTEVEAVQAALLWALGAHGCTVDATLACGYYSPSTDPALDVADHPMRKPRPGMFLRAAEIMNLDLAASLVVGDRSGDLLAGARAGLRTGFIVGDDPCGGLPPLFAWRRLQSPADWQALEQAISAAAPPR
jgi:D-glycero-D-manno-heptose 1,7-bisphosphate phosphatase